ncbi:MAG: CBS domain-containing protein [Coleofasciculaceae cyanobacterium RL_1_1]|nr:CBS domain-containing protein [Coleofasciculaceae cyanobacterium RL_1_1]
MDLILCHTTADFDSLGAAVGLARLRPGSRIVLTGGAHPGVEMFLRLHRDEYPLIERRSVNPKTIRSIAIVDTQHRDRIGKAAEWLDLPQLTTIEVFDHHLGSRSDIPATDRHIHDIGATTTLIVEQLQAASVTLNVHEATVMALAIHVDTGSLTYDRATTRDALALAWLMQQGANQHVIAQYIEPGLSTELQDLLVVALDRYTAQDVCGYTVGSVLLETDRYIPGLSGLASRLLELTDSDALILGHAYDTKSGNNPRFSAIGRSRIPDTDLNPIFRDFSGGGHAKAASAQIATDHPDRTLAMILDRLIDDIPHPPVARDLMSSPVRTIRPDTTIGEAHRILLRYGHSGLSVVDDTDALVGIISRRDLDIALHHRLDHAPVKGYMTNQLKTIAPDTSLPDIETLMVTYDIGRLPVIDRGNLVGIVTRTDVLRELHQDYVTVCHLPQTGSGFASKRPTRLADLEALLWQTLEQRLPEKLRSLLFDTAEAAEARGWHLYLVGGAVRDLLLAAFRDLDQQDPANHRAKTCDESIGLLDIDLVVDGFHRAATVGAGVELAQVLQEKYRGAKLEVHGQFQTAALTWRKDPVLDSLWIDIATARTEFYPYPAANPEVEASSIRQDLYRRDFTINALALRLTYPRRGKLLDFLGGTIDLQNQQIRVLHTNSFIEDPTRIYRAVRFAVRLGFAIEAQTEGYIRHAIHSGIYPRSQAENDRTPALQTRLKAELKYLLQAPYWKPALLMLADLEALQCIHPSLRLTDEIWWNIRLTDRWLRRFDPDRTIAHWQAILETLLSHLAPEFRGTIAQSLQLPDTSITRLRTLETTLKTVTLGLQTSARSSEIYYTLQPYDRLTLLLVVLHCDRSVRRKIWIYLNQLIDVAPILNGRDLQQLGYKPSPVFKEILADVLTKTLDGEFGVNSIQDRKQYAIHYVRERYS